MTELAILAGIMTGMLLGIFGSGGSIITLPALLYLLAVEPKQAIAMSLGIVAMTASIAALNHWRKGNINVPVTVVFSLFSAVGTFAGAKIGVNMPVSVQLGLFVAIMYLAAYRMMRAKPVAASIAVVANADIGITEQSVVAPTRLGPIALYGGIVGVLTGIVGVGGGFLIVPALVLLSNITMKQAIGTSLAIVAVKSFAGFAGYVGAVPIDYALMGTFSAVAIASSFVGSAISHRLSTVALKKGFAIFLVIIATYIMIKEFSGI